MLIGIDASRANRLRKTGTEWSSYHLIRALAQLDDHNQYLLYTDEPLKDGLLDLSALESSVIKRDYQFDHNGDQTLISPHHNFRGRVLHWPFTFFWTLGRFSLEMIRQRPDVLFVPAHGLPLVCPAKTVATIHDIGFKRADELYGPEQITNNSRILNSLVRVFTRGRYQATKRDYLDWSTDFALRKARAIITISEFSKRELAAVNQAAGDKIKVIHNGYDKIFNPQADTEEAKKKILDRYGLEEPFVFYLGRLEKKKNIGCLVEAFSILLQDHPTCRHRLCLAGIPGFGYQNIKNLVYRYELREKVQLVDWIRQVDLPIVYRAATAFVFPSKYEGFGIPVLEALACGVPAAVSGAASLPEVAGAGALYFNPDDPRDIAAKLWQLISDETTRARLRAIGLEQVKKFSWGKAARQTLQVLENL